MANTVTRLHSLTCCNPNAAFAQVTQQHRIVAAPDDEMITFQARGIGFGNPHVWHGVFGAKHFPVAIA